MLEMKLVLRAALRRYTLETGGRFERTRRRSITLSPRAGARIVLLPRPGGNGSAGYRRQATESACLDEPVEPSSYR
jgi:hypothetical protein